MLIFYNSINIKFQYQKIFFITCADIGYFFNHSSVVVICFLSSPVNWLLLKHIRIGKFLLPQSLTLSDPVSVVVFVAPQEVQEAEPDVAL